MNVRATALLLIIPVAAAAFAGVAVLARGQAGGESLDLRPLVYEETAVAGGHTHGLITGDDDGAWLTTGRLIQPIDLADPASPRVVGTPERLPTYLGGMSRRAGVAWAYDHEGLWRRDPAEVGAGIWQLAWHLDDGAPVPADSPQDSYDFIRQITLPTDLPELVLLHTRGGLRVLGVDEMGVPEELAFVPRISGEHRTIAMAYAQGRAFLLEFREPTITLRSADLSDPAAPIESGTYRVDLDVDAFPPQTLSEWLLHAQDRRIYLAGADRLVVLEPPATAAPGLPLQAPVELGTLALDARPWNLLPDGDRLWMISRGAVLDPPMLRGIAVTDPTQPRWLGTPMMLEPTYYIPHSYSHTHAHHSPGIGLSRAGDYLLLSDGPGGQLRSVDVRDPVAPRVVGHLDRLGECRATVHSAGWTYCYAAEGLIPLADSEGRPVLAQDAGAPRESLGYTMAVAVDGGVAWLDAETGRLRMYGIDPPAVPVPYAELKLTEAYLLEAAGRYLYIASGEPGMQGNNDRLLVVDLGIRHLPTVVRVLELPVEGIVSSAVGGDTLFLSSYNQGILAYDLSEPALPRLVGSYDRIPDIRPDIVWHAGSLVVFPHEPERETDMIILDARDPAHLRERSRYAFDDFFAVAQNSVTHAVDTERGEIYVYVYRSTSVGIDVLDVNDPDHVRRVADIDVVAAVTAITLDGDRVFVSSDRAGVSIWERRLGEQPPSLSLPFVE